MGSRQENFGVRRINVEASTGTQFVTRTLQYSFRDTLGSQTATVFGKDTTSKKIQTCHNMVIMKLHEVVFPLLSHLTAQPRSTLSCPLCPAADATAERMPEARAASKVPSGWDDDDVG